MFSKLTAGKEWIYGYKDIAWTGFAAVKEYIGGIV